MAQLKYLQLILLEFDNVKTPEELYLIRFFRKDLKLSIKAQIEQPGQELNS